MWRELNPSFQAMSLRKVLQTEYKVKYSVLSSKVYFTLFEKFSFYTSVETYMKSLLNRNHYKGRYEKRRELEVMSWLWLGYDCIIYSIFSLLDLAKGVKRALTEDEASSSYFCTPVSKM